VSVGLGSGVVGVGVGVVVGVGVGVGVGAGVVGVGVGLGVGVASPPQAVNAITDTISVSANIINNTLFFIGLPPQVLRFLSHLISHLSPII
jgi:hypothetical protein